MASKYLQKYPVPAGFEQVLHDFAREVLRDQPDNIIEYAASYFEMLEQGKKFEYESKFNVKKTQKKTNLEYNSKTATQLAQKAGNAVNLINQNAEKQEEKRKLQANSKKSLGVKSHEIAIGTQKQPQYAAPRPDSQHSKHSKHSNAQQPSIQNFSQPQQRPASGVSKKSKTSHVNVHEPSSTTLMKEQGKKFIHEVNKGAANAANIEEIKQQTPSQLQSQLASKYVQEESNSLLNKLQQNNQLDPLSVQLIEASQQAILGQNQKKNSVKSSKNQLVETKQQGQQNQQNEIIDTNNVNETDNNQQVQVAKQQQILSSLKNEKQKQQLSNTNQYPDNILSADKRSDTQEQRQEQSQQKEQLQQKPQEQSQEQYQEQSFEQPEVQSGEQSKEQPNQQVVIIDPIKSKPQSAKSNQSAPKNE